MSRFLLSHAIMQAAEQRPDQEAIRVNKSGLTYQELVARSNSLANALLDRGIQRGDRIGIYMNKSLESAVSVYGSMIAGAVYVPLDPFAPVERLRFVIRDCGIQTILTNEAKRETLLEILQEPTELSRLVGLSQEVEPNLQTIPWEEIHSYSSTSPPNLGTTEKDLAYILYTSGSTGVPKGIMHTHRSGLSFAEWAVSTYGLTSEDRLSNHAPLHFDLSTFDFFAGSIAGATTILIPEPVTKFPASLAKLIADENLTVWYSVPFALIQLLLHGNLPVHDLKSLRWVLFAGEPFPTKHLRRLMAVLPHARYSNLYGPTETNVCTYYHVPSLAEDSDAPIPVGQPCANVEALVVTADDQPVQAGEVGELLIRGGVVMQGYWGQPEKTETAFFRRKSQASTEDLYYRTGDLVQLNADGDYEYLGRKDRQIKTRGYRVELDEIEVNLLAHPGIEEAAVYPVQDDLGSNLIEAAVILVDGTEASPDELIGYLAGRVPSYALPVKLLIMENFPRTSTGKIDRRELQAQAMPANARD